MGLAVFQKVSFKLRRKPPRSPRKVKIPRTRISVSTSFPYMSYERLLVGLLYLTVHVGDELALLKIDVFTPQHGNPYESTMVMG